MYELIKPFLFSLPPETAHHFALSTLKMMHALQLTHLYPKVMQPKTVMGLSFQNPIGLAAGLDKDGDYIDCLAGLGFGFIEIGTVTPQPQIGNAKPRLFRLIQDEALINRMGFNSKGLNYVVERLKKTKYRGILGVNIGKNRETPLKNANEDYLLCFRKVAPYASYITINISSPNTPGLRELQQQNYLADLLTKLKYEQTLQKKYVPLVVKISPDLTQQELQEMCTIFLATKVDGVIATNTTIARKGLINTEYVNEEGGLSGKPLFNSSTEIVKELNSILHNRIPIIACGGIFSKEDAQNKINSGASLLQIYTSFIYHGPRIIRKLIFP